MNYFLVVAPAVYVAAAAFLWLLFSPTRAGALPPLEINPKDPLMKEAVARAKESLQLFCELAAQPHRSRRVKLAVVTTSGAREYLWADLLSITGSEMTIRYLLPPGQKELLFNRVATRQLPELVDWQVESRDGTYTGGFTIRVMLQRGREQWGTLPPELEAEAGKYGIASPLPEPVSLPAPDVALAATGA